MSEEVLEKDSVKEIDLQRVVSVLLRKCWLIILCGVLAAAIAFGGTFYFVTPQYRSSTLMYVNNSPVSFGNVEVSYQDLTVRKDLVKTYIVILSTRDFLLDVVDYAGVDRSYQEVGNMISAESVDETEIFRVSVTSPDPEEAYKIATAIAEILPKKIGDIIKGTTAVVVDTPIVATSPSSPNYTKNTLLGFLVGFLLCTAVLVLREIFDVTIRSEEDVQSKAHPVLASVPDMLSQSKGGYYYGSKDRGASGDKSPALLGHDISFAASEAYKLLRTKLQFSFVDDSDCHILGVSSALTGEGKSLSSVNLAYSLAQLEKRVLLVDCDMRRPSLNVKLGLQKTPGLSNYLTRQVSEQEVIQKYATEDCAFDVITSGRNPPNPIELLSSERMSKVLERLKASYDYIILDLPPVGEVSDALVAARMVDGMLLVVRQNYCSRTALADALKQFHFVDAKILGIVLNCTTESGSRYGKHYRYYKRYYNRYGGAYTASSKSAKHTAKQEKEQ